MRPVTPFIAIRSVLRDGLQESVVMSYLSVNGCDSVASRSLQEGAARRAECCMWMLRLRNALSTLSCYCGPVKPGPSTTAATGRPTDHGGSSNMAVTLHDVATRAGVSQATASRVLNGS